MSGYGQGPDDPSVPQYPSAPQYQPAPEYAGGGGPTTPVALPPTVHWASICMIIRTAIAVIGLFVTLARLDDIADEVVRKSPTVTRDSARAAVVFGTVIALIFAAALLALAFLVRRGRNWARITAIVLSALGIIGGLFTFAQPYGAAVVLLNTVSLLLAVATVVLLLMPDSNAYFKGQQRTP
jgi:hypothetical protein